MKAQEEETMLPAQIFIPSALSIRNDIRQKYKKYVTHVEQLCTNLNKDKQIEIIHHTFCNKIPHRASNRIKQGWKYLRMLMPNTLNDTKTSKQAVPNWKTKTMLNATCNEA